MLSAGQPGIMCMLKDLTMLWNITHVKEIYGQFFTRLIGLLKELKDITFLKRKFDQKYSNFFEEDVEK